MDGYKWFMVCFVVLMIAVGAVHSSSKKLESPPQVYVFKITGVMQDITEFIPLYAVLQAGRRGDQVHILINSTGGLVLISELTRQYMRQSEATIHTYVRQEASSAAADILFSGDVVHVHYEAEVMVHTGQWYDPMTGKRELTTSGTPFYAYRISTSRYLYAVTSLLCWGPVNCMNTPTKPLILTAEEWAIFKTGSDVDLTGEELCRRLSSSVKYSHKGTSCVFKGGY